MVGICPSPNLYEVLVTGYCIEGKLRLPAAEIVVTSDQVARLGIAAAAVIDSELSVEAAAAQTDGNLTCSRSSIAVPNVWTGHTVAGTIKMCVFVAESQIGYIAYVYCVNAITHGADILSGIVPASIFHYKSRSYCYQRIFLQSGMQNAV